MVWWPVARLYGIDRFNYLANLRSIKTASNLLTIYRFLSLKITFISIINRERQEEEERTLLDGENDAHLTARSRRWITHGFANVNSSVLELDVGYLQTTVDISAAGRQRKTIAANPTYSGT